jgi:hypothetical protein
MDEKDGGLDRLCKVYEKLDDGDKEKVIRLAEGLLDTQKANDDKKKPFKQENFRTKFVNLDSSKR